MSLFRIFIIIILLSSCNNITNLHNVEHELSLIKINIINHQNSAKSINNRKLRKFLLDQLGRSNSQAKYSMNIDYSISEGGMSILPNSRISSYKTIASGSYSLYLNNKLVHQKNNLRARNIYEPSNSPYATKIAQEKSEENALRNFADLIRQDLTLYFANK